MARILSRRALGATALAIALIAFAGCEREEPDLSAAPDTGSTDPAAPIPGDADPAATAVIDSWATNLSRGDIAAAARQFAIPSVAENGPASIRIRDAADARVFNASLPCGARLTQATQTGEIVIATFELSERPGPGSCGAGTGQTARTAFVIEDGKIVVWRRVPDEDAAATPDNPA